MSNTYRSERSNDPSRSQQQSDDSTVIRRTLVERGLRPVNDGNQTTSTIAAITTITKQHEDEQRELQELNNKFAVYLDRVQYLENYNHRLLQDLKDLKQTWGGDAAEIQSRYGPQLQKLREDIDNALRDQALQELQIKRQEYDLWQIQQQIATLDADNDLNRLNLLKQELDASNVEIENLQNQLDQNLSNLSKHQNIMDNLLKDLNDLKNELDTQQLERIIIENELQTLREHASFQDAIYQEQRKEILSLNSPVLDVSRFYRTELARAISDIRQDFEVLSQSQVNELEEYYRIKTEQVRAEIESENERKRLLASEGALESMDVTHLTSSIRDNQTDLQSLQAEYRQLQSVLDAIVDDFEKIQDEHLHEKQSYDQELVRLRQEITDKQETIDSLLANNVSLRFELSTYRRLLDVEEQHMNRVEQGQQLQSAGPGFVSSSSSSTYTSTQPGSTSGFPSSSQPGYTQSSSQSGYTQPLSSGFVSSSSPSQPGYTSSSQPGYASSSQPGYTSSSQPGYTSSSQPGYASSSQPGYTSSSQPGYTSSSQPGYTSSPQPGYTSSSQPGYTSSPQPGYTSSQPGYTSSQPGYTSSPQPGYTSSSQPGYTSSPQPGYTSSPQPGYTSSSQPGYTSSPQPGYTSSPQPGYTSSPQPGYTSSPQPGYTSSSQPGYTSSPQPGYTSSSQPGYTSSPQPGYTSSSQPGYTSSPQPGYTSSSQPGYTPGSTTGYVSSSITSPGSATSSQPGYTPGATTGYVSSSSSTASPGSASSYQIQQTPNRALNDLGTKKMTVQKTARGPISFDSVDLETDSVILVNEEYSRGEQSFRNWTIRRQIDEQPEITYQFPSTFSLKPRQTIRIFSKRSPYSSKGIGDRLIADKIDTWGIGQKMVTRLIDDKNEEKAIITQIFQ